MRVGMMALLVVSVVFGPATMAAADNDVGCGVGTEIWKGKSGLGYKLAASSTNGMTFQSISITSGLVNCNGMDTITADARVRHFTSENFDRLARDMSSGEGETLSALATLLFVDGADRTAFYRLTQVHFAELFAGEHATSSAMLSALDRLLSTDERLAVYARS